MGVELGFWLRQKTARYGMGIYGVNVGSVWTTVDMQATRVEQLGVKSTEAQPYQVAPDDYGDTSYPETILSDYLIINKTFRISGILSDSGTRYAVDRKRYLIAMSDSGGTGSLKLNLVPNASGIATGSEFYEVNFLNYNFIHETPSVQKYSYQIMLIAGSQVVR